MSDFPVTIFHNPACGTSRNTLGMIRAAGYEPTVVEYLQAGWTRPQLEALLADMGAAPRDILRAKEGAALLAEGVGDEALLEAMVREPKLVQRPIVVTPLGTGMCRPSEAVLDLLETKPERFVKEDGEVVVGRG